MEDFIKATAMNRELKWRERMKQGNANRNENGSIEFQTNERTNEWIELQQKRISIGRKKKNL